jgi:hypothetical protein
MPASSSKIMPGGCALVQTVTDRGLVDPFSRPGLVATTTISAAAIRANLAVDEFQGRDDLAFR